MDTALIQVKIKRPCREPEPHNIRGVAGVHCPDCQAHSYRKDSLIDHEEVEEWIYLSELKVLLEAE